MWIACLTIVSTFLLIALWCAILLAPLRRLPNSFQQLLGSVMSLGYNQPRYHPTAILACISGYYRCCPNCGSLGTQVSVGRNRCHLLSPLWHHKHFQQIDVYTIFWCHNVAVTKGSYKFCCFIAMGICFMMGVQEASSCPLSPTGLGRHPLGLSCPVLCRIGLFKPRECLPTFLCF